MSSDWTKGNRYLTDNEMQGNAQLFSTLMTEYGFTLNAIAGMLGNIQTESTINPAIWQNLTPAIDSGYGLVQWTPATVYTEWATSNGYTVDSGNGQCEWINSMTETTGQWIPTAEYPMTWGEYKKSTDTPEKLAYAFLFNFERPANLIQPDRQTQARKWYNYLGGTAPTPSPIPSSKKKLPIWMMCRRIY